MRVKEMGWQARISTSRTCGGCGGVHYATAKEMAEISKTCEIAERLGLILPGNGLILDSRNEVDDE